MTRASDTARLLGAGATILDGTTISTADNTDSLTLQSTDADANVGPVMLFKRDSSSPAASDFLGYTKYSGENNADEETIYAQTFSQIVDVTNGSEDGTFAIDTMVAGTLRARVEVAPTETVFNEDSVDLDFRVESDSNANAFFLEGSSGNVGIGGAPNNWGGMNRTLELIGSSDVQLAIHANSDSLSDDARIGEVAFFAGTTNTLPNVATIVGRVSGTDEAKGILSFHTRGTDTGGLPQERMRVTQNGNLAIGTTIEYAKLHVTSQGNLTTPAMFEDTTTGTSSVTAVVLKRNGSNVGAINTTNTSTAYVTSSDARLKENVVEMTDATTRLKQLQPKRFNFIADADTTVDGFLAHEVQSVVPEAITGTHNEVDADGNPVYQGIDQSKLVPLLVKTIQELEARIVALETA